MSASSTTAAPAPIRLRAIGGRAARALRSGAGILLIALVWEAGSRITRNRLMPSWADMLEAVRALERQGVLWDALWHTTSSFLLALAVAVVAGLVLGLLAAELRLLEVALMPILRATYGSPRTALFPVLTLIFGLGRTAGLVLAALEAFYPLVYGAYAGARSIEKRYGWLALNVEAGYWRRLRDVVLPSALPSMMVGVRIAAPITLLVTIFTELFGSGQGLGYLVAESQGLLQPARALGLIVIIGVVGFVIDRTVHRLTLRLVPWEGTASL